MIMDSKIGVFICDCNGEIGSTIDIDMIINKLSFDEEITFAEKIPYACSPHGEEIIQQRIRNDSLNRLVLLSCSPRIMEKRFQKVCADAGLNPSLLEMVNLRDQCAWIHQNDPDDANRKAWDIIKIGIERARYLTPIETMKAEIYPVVAVIGGGLSGMTAALSLANQNIQVILVEKEAKIGGSIWKVNHTQSEVDGEVEIVKKLSKQIQQSKNIEVLVQSEPVEVSGSYGKYEITLKYHDQVKKITCGAVILAMGAEELKPDGYYGYGKNDKVITQNELHHFLAVGSTVEGLENVVMIQCVGARNEERPYCSRTCCITAVKNAIILKEKAPTLGVTILYRDIPKEPGPDRQMLDQAIELGVKFLQFSGQDPPKVTTSTVKGISLEGKPFKLPYDLVILSPPLIPHKSSQKLAQEFCIQVDQFGFIPDALPNLKPQQYSEPCIHVVGNAHWPCTVSEATYQAYGQAARIASLIRQGNVEMTRVTASVNINACRGCATCLEWCPFDVPVIKPLNGSDPVSTVDPFLCKGCGSCVVHCPNGAMTMSNLDDEILQRMIDVALSDREKTEIKAISFLCEWSGYAAADLAGTQRKSLPSEIIPIRIPCAGRISTGLILHAFASGADGVLICACKRGDCHYLSGNTNCESVASETYNLLGLLGIPRSRFQMAHIDPVDVDGFSYTLEHFVTTIEKLKPAIFTVEEVT